MRKLQKLLCAAALAALVAVAAPSGAEATPILRIDPSTQTVPSGPVSADIVVDGLTGEVLTGFSAVLSFDETVLTFLDYTIGSSLLPGSALAFDGTDVSNAGTGVLDFFFTSGDLFADLFAAQSGTSFVLATVNFTGAPGFSPLNLSLAGQAATPLTQIDGNETVTDLSATLQDGSVCVNDNLDPEGCRTVPEPGLMALLGAGLCAFAVRRHSLANRS